MTANTAYWVNEGYLDGLVASAQTVVAEMMQSAHENLSGQNHYDSIRNLGGSQFMMSAVTHRCVRAVYEQQNIPSGVTLDQANLWGDMTSFCASNANALYPSNGESAGFFDETPDQHHALTYKFGYEWGITNNPGGNQGQGKGNGKSKGR